MSYTRPTKYVKSFPKSEICCKSFPANCSPMFGKKGSDSMSEFRLMRWMRRPIRFSVSGTAESGVLVTLQVSKSDRLSLL